MGRGRTSRVGQDPRPAAARRVPSSQVGHSAPPGGVLVYSVCSLQPEEGPAIIEELLKNQGDFTRLPVTASETGAPPETITPDGDMRTLPCHLAELGGMDGFYIARLQRQPAV